MRGIKQLLDLSKLSLAPDERRELHGEIIGLAVWRFGRGEVIWERGTTRLKELSGAHEFLERMPAGAARSHARREVADHKSPGRRGERYWPAVTGRHEAGHAIEHRA